jgi:hypothetical protein
MNPIKNKIPSIRIRENINIISKKLKIGMKTIESLKQHLLEMISDGEIQKAIDTLMNSELDDYFRDNIIMISSRYNFFRSQKAGGVLSTSEQETTRNRIIENLIDCVNLIFEKKIPKSVEVRRSVTIELNGDIEHFSDEKKIAFCAAILTLLNVDSNITIRRIESGSVKITIELPLDQCQLLLEKIENTQIGDQRVIATYPSKELLEEMIYDEIEKITLTINNSDRENPEWVSIESLLFSLLSDVRSEVFSLSDCYGVFKTLRSLNKISNRLRRRDNTSRENNNESRRGRASS